MRTSIALVAALAALATAGAANAASVDIRDAVARVTVIPEDRNDVKVEFLTTNADLPLQVRTVGGETIIDGDLDRRINNCQGKRDSYAAYVRGVGRVSYDNVPQVVIRTPRAVGQLQRRGVRYGRSLGEPRLAQPGCQRLDHRRRRRRRHRARFRRGLGEDRLSGRLDLRLSGRGGSTPRVSARPRGLALRRRLVDVDDLAGSMDARVSGVGKIRVTDGHAGAVRASVSGMGSVEFDGAAERLDASISGLGNIRVKHVNGSVSKSVTGGGHVTIGDRS